MADVSQASGVTRLGDVEAGFSSIGWPGHIVVLTTTVVGSPRELGRSLAARGMSALGITPSPVGRSADRSPIWPTGICGSIAHTDDSSVVAVGRDSSSRIALGIDVERLEGVSNSLSRTVLTDAERAALEHLEMGEASSAVALAFCVKEAVYKAQYPLTNALLDFHDLELTWQRAPDGSATPHGIVHGNDPLLARIRLCAFVRRVGPFVVAGAVATQ